MNAESDIPTLDEFTERALAGIGKALEDAAEARAKAEELDEIRKQKKSAMVVHYRDQGNGIAEAQERAQASPEYREATERWVTANYAYRRSDALVEARRIAWETWRTVQATRRAEIGLR
jgi:hypothetical protein